MPQLTIEETRIKNLLKQALMELLQEHREVFYDVIAEALEDMALVNAIKEGESTENASRSEVFEILRGAA